MTLRRLGIDSIKDVLNGFTLPAGILVLIAMMLPLPVYLLDTFFVTNILLSLLIAAISYHRPLEFSSFRSRY